MGGNGTQTTTYLRLKITPSTVEGMVELLDKLGELNRRLGRSTIVEVPLPHPTRPRASPTQIEDMVDTLTLTGGRAAALQTGLLPAAAVQKPGWLHSFGEGYFGYLGTLPLLRVVRTAEGGHRIELWFAPGRLALLRFAPPYLAANRSGRELRYPIAGGLLVRGRSGYIAFGQAPNGGRARVWIEVLEFSPRLGLGPLYVLTQVVLHRMVTVAYLRQIAAAG